MFFVNLRLATARNKNINKILIKNINNINKKFNQSICMYDIQIYYNFLN